MSKPLTTASERIGAGVDGLRQLIHLEVVVTTLCLFIPLILLVGDGGNVREHISGYYDMPKGQYFYFPLTVAAMLFVVNGTVKTRHWYNLWLGLALVGVVLFNYVDHRLIHNLSAGAFFIGNAVVFVVFSPKKEVWFKLLLTATMILGFLGHVPFGWYSLFWAESLSLWVIAAHFVLEAKGLIR